jgi:two-component system, cell cycle sensor histidine kinase and response regulator CckA
LYIVKAADMSSHLAPSPQCARLLVAGLSPHDAAAVQAALCEFDGALALDVDTHLDAHDALEYDAIVCGEHGPALERIRSRDAKIPLLVVCADDRRGVEALRRGASDYVVKGALARLPFALQRELDGAIYDIERHGVAELVHDVRETYSKIFDNAPIGIVRADVHGNILSANARYAAIVGRRREELIGRHFSMLLPPASRAEAIAQFNDYVRTSGEARYTRRYLHPDGTIASAHVTLATIAGANGKPEGVVALVEETTRRERIEHDLRAHEEQLAEAQRIANIGSWEYDLATGQRTFSDHMCRMYGISRHASLEDLYARVHPDDRDAVRALEQHAHQTLQPFSCEVRVLPGDGTTRTIQSRGRFVVDEHGTPVKLVGVVQDITDRVQHEEELRRIAVQQAAVANLGQLALSALNGDFLVRQVTALTGSILDVDSCDVVPSVPAEAPGRHVVPIVAAETTHGAIEIRLREGQTLSATDCDFVRSVATIVGQALERERADAEIHARARQQSAIAQLGRRTMTTLDDAALARACELVVSGLGADAATFFELSPGDVLHRRADCHWPQELPVRLEVDEASAVGTVALRREPVVIYDLAAETRFPMAHLAANAGFVSVVIVPVASATRSFGVLSAHTRSPRRFWPADVDFLQSLANVLAEAMEREEARQALVESEERNRSVVEGASEIIFSVDRNGTLVSLNRAFEQLTGTPREAWIGRDFRPLIHPDDLPRVEKAFRTALTTQQSQAYECRLTANPRCPLLDVTLFPLLRDGAVIGVHGFGRDITESRRVELEREQLTRSLQLLLESTLEGIYAMDRDGRCTIVNAAACRMLGRAPEEMLGRNVHAMMHASHDDCAILCVARDGMPRKMIDETFWRADGTPLPVDYSAAPISDEGRAAGVVVAFTDATERRKLEQKLEQANRLSSLGRLAATVAHEFNNVLMGISPFVELIRLRPDRTPSALDQIAGAITRGKRITEEILRFARPAELVPVVFEVEPWLRAVVQEAESLLGTSFRVTLHVHGPALRLSADRSQLHQVLMNLIVNARDAMTPGGTIAISARGEPPDASFPFGFVERPERFVHLAVSDDGAGMPPETLRHIFEPLFTTKRSGTGLGLAVAHQVVQRHGGEIFAESTAGAGSAFHIFMPAAEPGGEVAQQSASDPAPKHCAARHVLLVDDDETVVAGLVILLELEGLRVDAVGTGAEAVDYVRNTTPDAVVLDVGLPDMDGTEVYTRMTALRPSLPVVFSTGHADAARLDAFRANERVTSLLKPYDISTLLAAIETVTA